MMRLKKRKRLLFVSPRFDVDSALKKIQKWHERKSADGRREDSPRFGFYVEKNNLTWYFDCLLRKKHKFDLLEIPWISSIVGDEIHPIDALPLWENIWKMIIQVWPMSNVNRDWYIHSKRYWRWVDRILFSPLVTLVTVNAIALGLLLLKLSQIKPESITWVYCCKQEGSMRKNETELLSFRNSESALTRRRWIFRSKLNRKRKAFISV